MTFRKILFSLIALITILAIIGFLLPWLMSAKSTVAVGIGISIMILLTAAAIFYTLKFISKYAIN